jgi:forkhead box protein K
MFESSMAMQAAQQKKKQGSSKVTARTVKPRPRRSVKLSIDSLDDLNWESCTYAEMIEIAILSSPSRQLYLSEIYAYLQENFGCFSEQDGSWKNSVRHNLSTHTQFERQKATPSPNAAPRRAKAKGAAGTWTLNLSMASDLARQLARKQSREMWSAVYSERARPSSPETMSVSSAGHSERDDAFTPPPVKRRRVSEDDSISLEEVALLLVSLGGSSTFAC